LEFFAEDRAILRRRASKNDKAKKGKEIAELHPGLHDSIFRNGISAGKNDHRMSPVSRELSRLDDAEREYRAEARSRY
jgi:hypothetical protein